MQVTFSVRTDREKAKRVCLTISFHKNLTNNDHFIAAFRQVRYPSLPVYQCAPSWQADLHSAWNVEPRTDLEDLPTQACFTLNIIMFIIDRVKCQMIH